MNATKLMVKLFLVISLFCATAFAEGNMGSGGFADDGNMGSGGYADDGNMGSGGYAETSDDTSADDPTNNEILEFVRDYLTSIFG